MRYVVRRAGRGMDYRMNYVTVASDASFDRGMSGFAYYIRDDNGVTARAWRGKKNEFNSSDATEVEAMLTALVILSDRKYPPDTKLIYYCDNMNVIRLINRHVYSDKSKKRKEWERLSHEVRFLTQQFIEIEGRHVKGHQKPGEYGIEEKKFYLNRWCDANASMMMKKNRYNNRYKEIK